MMKLKVHRVRFVDYIPQAIHCLAFEQIQPLPRLALSRADSSIEIWSIKNNDWHQLLIIPGCKGSSVEALVWCGARLFSAGLHGEITEWDLTRLAPKVSVDSFGGAVWSLAVNHAKTTLAAGCEDGLTRLYDITDSGLEYKRAIDNQGGRILSLCWHISDNILATASSNGTVKLFVVATGHCNLRLRVEDSPKRTTLVWNVHILSDFTIITGDSLGNTQFWDGKHGTLLQSYSAHRADVLAMCINEKEDTVFSSGVDSKVVQFKLIVKENHQKQWVKSSVSRAHSHDVRALALMETKDWLVSGGVDTKLGVHTISTFGNLQPKLILPFPHMAIIHVASQANILMFQQQCTLQFWRLGETVEDGSVLAKPAVKLLHLSTKGSHHIVCSALSACGKWAAFSDICHISIFRLNLDSKTATNLTIKRVLPLPPSISPAQHLVFTQDSSKLICATNEQSIQVVALGDELALLNTFSVPGEELSRHLAVSDNGHWAACVNSRNEVNVFDLEHSKHHCTLSTISAEVTAIAFQPRSHALALVNTNCQIYLYGIENSRLTEWSKQMAGVPPQWLGSHSKVVGITFSPTNHNLMVLQRHDSFTILDLHQTISEADASVCINTKREKSRKRTMHREESDWRPNKKKHDRRQYTLDEMGEKKCQTKDSKSNNIMQNALKVCKKYQFVLFTGFCGDNSLVIVERPWLHVLEALPPTLFRKHYGR